MGGEGGETKHGAWRLETGDNGQRAPSERLGFAGRPLRPRYPSTLRPLGLCAPFVDLGLKTTRMGHIWAFILRPNLS